MPRTIKTTRIVLNGTAAEVALQRYARARKGPAVLALYSYRDGRPVRQPLIGIGDTPESYWRSAKWIAAEIQGATPAELSDAEIQTVQTALADLWPLPIVENAAA